MFFRRESPSHGMTCPCWWVKGPPHLFSPIHLISCRAAAKVWGSVLCCTFVLTRRSKPCLCLCPKRHFVPELGEAAARSLWQGAEPAAHVP